SALQPRVGRCGYPGIANEKCSINRKAVASFPRLINLGANALRLGELAKLITQGSRSGNSGLGDTTALSFGAQRNGQLVSNSTLVNQYGSFALDDDFTVLVRANRLEFHYQLVITNRDNRDPRSNRIARKNRRDKLECLPKINATLPGQLVGDDGGN